MCAWERRKLSSLVYVQECAGVAACRQKDLRRNAHGDAADDPSRARRL